MGIFFILKDWNENCRYLCCGTKSQQETFELINAIDNNVNGVLTWTLAPDGLIATNTFKQFFSGITVKVL